MRAMRTTRLDEQSGANIQISFTLNYRWSIFVSYPGEECEARSDRNSDITIADYFGVGLLTLGEIVRCDFSAYPNIQRWLANMKRLKSRQAINEVSYGFAESVKDRQFVAI